jgi:hypothetical protein
MSDAERNVSVGDSAPSVSAGESESYASPDYTLEEPTFDETSSSYSDEEQDGSSNEINNSLGSNVVREVAEFNQYFYGRMHDSGIAVEERKALVDFTSDLPLNLVLDPHLDFDSIEDYVYKLRSDRLILISCANDQLAFDSAQSIVARLDLAKANQLRFLDLKRAAREKCGPSIDVLRNGKAQLDELAVVIDAVSEPAQAFLDDLLNASGGALNSIRLSLVQFNLYLVCIVNNDDVIAKLVYNDRSGSFQRECPIPHWDIPFLRPMLQRYFPNEYAELEAKIMAMRNEWDPDDRKFKLRIEALIKGGRLKTHLSSAQPQKEYVQSEALFLGDKSLRDYVMYVGVHFPGLNPREFQRVVSLLLQDKTVTVAVPSTITHDDGKVEKIEIEKERPLLDLWRESMDKIQRESHLITCLVQDGQTVVDFKDHRIREQLKEHLNQEYSFFLTAQFEQLLNLGLLFDPSLRIAEGFTQRMAEMIASDPEYYGYEWICQLLSRLEKINIEGQVENEGELFPTLSGVTVKQVNSLIYRRISHLIRRLLDSQAQDVVNELFEQLIRRKLHTSALELVKRLRFVPQFEEFYWLRQLIERGDKAATEGTFLYLCYYMQSTGARVYTVLDGLDEWIKKDARPEAYSRATEEALQLIFFYCSSLKVSDSSFASLHPLFSFPDADSAKLNLDLVTRSLFHPWMEKSIHTLKPNLRVLASIGELISDWVFGILRTTAEANTMVHLQSNTNRISPAETVRILLQQVVASSTTQQQDRLLKFWRSKSVRLMERINALPYGSEGRNELVDKRNALDETIAQFLGFTTTTAH